VTGAPDAAPTPPEPSVPGTRAAGTATPGTAAPGTPVLEARGVSRRYGPVTALDDVTVTIAKGASVGIVGESGSGKSTLSRLLLALEAPTAGEVRYQGQPVSGRRERELRAFRRGVQIVFQDPLSSLDPRMRVHDILAEPLRALDAGQEKTRVPELLDAVGLPASAARLYPHEFSGGQRQRIAIARALGPGPSVLVADEPVSALDVSVRAQILNLLRQLIADFSLTLVLISHDMAVVRHLCDEIVVLYRGRVVEHGGTDQVFGAPAHDYTRTLLAAVPALRRFDDD
jgi:ABC-type glutathione transport system ATPase component